MTTAIPEIGTPRLGRYTLSPVARQEVLDRLLELNHAHYADEVARGLHNPTKGRTTAPAQEQLNLGFKC
jgi:hypothetical protein